MSAAAAVIPVTAVAVTAGVARSSTQTTPYSLSGLPAQSRQPSVASLPITAGPRFATAQHTAASLSVGANVDMIGSSDVVQQSVINGTNVFTCNPGKDTAQNETTIASQGSTLIGGANDCRLYEPSENRYDGSGGFYRSTNSGSTWHAGFLPGLVRANTGAPGPYESAGDPAVASGPNGTFWYANLAFNRSDAANSVAVSRSTNGGKTWLTHFVIQTSAQQGTGLFNDKERVAADPSDPSGNTAYVTWTQFHDSSSPIVISKTTDGGVHCTAPQTVSSGLVLDQGSTVVVERDGTVYVTFESFQGGIAPLRSRSHTRRSRRA